MGACQTGNIAEYSVLINTFYVCFGCNYLPISYRNNLSTILDYKNKEKQAVLLRSIKGRRVLPPDRGAGQA